MDEQDLIDPDLVRSLTEFVVKLGDRRILSPDEMQVLCQLVARGDSVVMAAYKVRDSAVTRESDRCGKQEGSGG